MRAVPLLAVLAVSALGIGGFALWQGQQTARLPEGFAAANGRVEVERVDIATKVPGRVAEITVREGDRVPAGTVIARMDDAEVRAKLLAARAAVRRATEAIAKAEAAIAIRNAEHDLSAVELRRAVELARRSAGPETEVDRRRAQHAVAEANIRGAEADLADAMAAREAAEADVAQIEAVLADHVLTTPAAGRVEYRLVHPGEVVPAGGRVVTVLDLTDVHMTVFLPTGEAGRTAYGAEARIVLDALPDYVFPGRVSFVAAEAQFTPKAVETADERTKLMYRVKLSADPGMLETFRDYVRAGLTGQAYVRLDPDTPWPDRLAPRLPDVPAR